MSAKDLRVSYSPKKGDACGEGNNNVGKRVESLAWCAHILHQRNAVVRTLIFSPEMIVFNSL